jgi:tetratricopeptide (TPR) repeat protein
MDENGFIYDIFISYTHERKDTMIADFLHRKLETYKLPRSMVKKGFSTGFRRVFKDDKELACTTDLNEEIREMLLRSRYLVVICSRHTAQSIWVAKEIQMFIDMGRVANIIMVLTDGAITENLPDNLCRLFADDLRDNGGRLFNEKVVDLRKHWIRSYQKNKLNNELFRIIAILIGGDLAVFRKVNQQRFIIQRILLACGMFSIYIPAIMYFAYQLDQSRSLKHEIDDQIANIKGAAAVSLYQQRVALTVFSDLSIKFPQQLGDLPGSKPVLAQILAENIHLLKEIERNHSDHDWVIHKQAMENLMTGNEYLLRGDKANAKRCFEESVRLATGLIKQKNELEPALLLVKSYLGLGSLLPKAETGEKSDFTACLAVLTTLAADHDGFKVNRKDLAFSFKVVGDLLDGSGYTTEAADAYRQCLKLAGKLAKDRETCLIMIMANNGLANLTAPIAQKIQCLRTTIRIGDSFVKANPDPEIFGLLSMSNIETAYYQALSGLNRAARDECRKGIELATRSGEKTNLAHSLMGSGMVMDILKDDGAAYHYYRKAISIWSGLVAQDGEKVSYLRDYTRTMGMMGEHLFAGGKYDQALKYYRKCTDISLDKSTLDNRYFHELDGLCFRGQARIMLKKRNPKQAQRLYSESLDGYGFFAGKGISPGLRNDWINTVGEASWCNILAGDNDEAQRLANSALRADPSRTRIKIYLAHIYLLKDQYENAEDIYREVKDLKADQKRTYGELIREDFKEMRSYGWVRPLMGKIERMLKL